MTEFIFYLDSYTGPGGYGGIYTRAVKLGKFIDECTKNGYPIVGIRFDSDSNNCELLTETPPGEVRQ